MSREQQERAALRWKRWLRKGVGCFFIIMLLGTLLTVSIDPNDPSFYRVML